MIKTNVSTQNYPLFIYIAGTATALIAAVLFLFWKLLLPGLALYVPFMVPVANIIFPLLILIGVVLYVLLVWGASCHVLRYKGAGQVLALYLRLLFGPALLVSRCSGVHWRKMSQAYISYLNRLVLLKNIHIRPDKILILIPHCLQWDKCPHKITRNSQNCHRCGQCPIGSILEMADSKGSYLAVATGGTLARQIVRERRPQAIVAIACERDLVSGMQDVFPMPVLGLLNKRPNGPCFNTDVDLDALKTLLETITGEEYGYTKHSLTKPH